MRGRRWFVAPLLALLFGLLAASAAASPPSAPAPGTFLVAEETVRDPRFARAVVLLLQHDRQGSVGLVVNRPLPAPATASLPGALFYGGPVAPEVLLVLFRGERPPQRCRPLFADVCVTGPGEAAGSAPGARLRVFSGYAGWGPGQLAAEVARGRWRLLPAAAARGGLALNGRKLKKNLFDLPPTSSVICLRRRGRWSVST